MGRPNNETLHKEIIMYTQDEANVLYPNINTSQVEMTDEEFLNYDVSEFLGNNY